MKGFKDFLLKGNVLELAVAVVIGAAFTAIVTAFTEHVVQPLVNTIGGTNAADGLGFRILSGNEKTFVDLGSVITQVINFVLVAAVVYFILVLPYEKLKARTAKPAAEDEVDVLVEIRDLLASQGRSGYGQSQVPPGAVPPGTVPSNPGGLYPGGQNPGGEVPPTGQFPRHQL